MNKGKYGLMRDLGLNDEVTITLPAHVLRGFLAAYLSTRWESSDATSIMTAIQDALFDPLWAKEQQAEAQRQHDEHQRLISGMIPGFPGPDIPPDAEGISGE